MSYTLHSATAPTNDGLAQIITSNASLYEMQGFSILQIVFSVQSCTSNRNRLVTKGTATAADRAWDIRVHNGTNQRIFLSWFEDGNSNVLLGSNSGTGTIVTDTEYMLLLCFDPGRAGGAGDPKLRAYFGTTNGSPAFVLNTAADPIGTAVTVAPWNNAAAFAVGKDPQSGTNAAMTTTSELYLSEGSPGGVTTDAAWFDALATYLWNGGNGIRTLRDYGLTIASSLPMAFPADVPATITDGNGSDTWTLSGTFLRTSTASANYLNHPVLWEPLATWRASNNVFEDAGGTDSAEHLDRVEVWRDRARRFALTATTTRRPLFLTTGRRFPGIYFDKYDFDAVSPSTSAPALGRWLALTGNTSFNPQNCTLIFVASCPAASGTDENSNVNNQFQTFGTVTGADAQRFALWSNKGSGLGDTVAKPYCFFRTGTHGDFGTSDTDRLFTPTSPTVYALVCSPTGTTMYVGSTSRSKTSATPITAAAAPGNMRIGSRVDATSPAGFVLEDIHAAWMVLSAFDVYNRSNMTLSELGDRMAAMAAELGVPQDPSFVKVALGSSTMQSNSSGIDNGIQSQLWHQSAGEQNAFQYNLATGGSRINDRNSAIWSTDEVIDNTANRIMLQHAGTPVRVDILAGINDLANVAAGGLEHTPATIITNLKDAIARVRTAAATAGSALSRLTVGTIFASQEITGSQETRRLELNNLLKDKKTSARDWTNVSDQGSLPNLQSVTATYFREELGNDKHLNNTGFTEIGPSWLNPLKLTFLLTPRWIPRFKPRARGRFAKPPLL